MIRGIRVDGYPIVFNTHTIHLTTLICSSSLSNLKSNDYNKNDTRRKTTTPIQYVQYKNISNDDDDDCNNDSNNNNDNDDNYINNG